MDRNELVLVAYESAKDRLTCSVDEFLNNTKDWDLTPVLVSGKIAGVLMNRGSEVHACILPDFFGKWFGKWVFGYISAIISREGKATTTVMSNRKAGHFFVKRLGFIEDRREGEVVHYVKRGSSWVSKQQQS